MNETPVWASDYLLVQAERYDECANQGDGQVSAAYVAEELRRIAWRILEAGY